MRTAVSIAVALAIVSVTFAQTENIILQHNEHLKLGEHYKIHQVNATIEIIAGIPGEVFMFEAIQKVNGQYVGPGDINLVYTAAGAQDVVVTFVGHNGHEYGAAQIKQAWISGWDFAATIKELKIAGDLGAEGPIWADAAGSLTVGGDVLNDLVIYYGALDGSLSVGGDVVGDIDVEGAITGPVTIKGDLCSRASGAKLTCGSLGSLTVDGDVLGDIDVEGAITGPVTIGGFLAGDLACASLGDLTLLVGGGGHSRAVPSPSTDPMTGR